MISVNDLVGLCGTWASKTFVRATPSSICKHLQSEVQELSDNPDDEEEAADCILLLFHLAYKQGWNLEQAVTNKLEKNTRRQWGQPDADGVVEHVRTKDTQDYEIEKFVASLDCFHRSLRTRE